MCWESPMYGRIFGAVGALAALAPAAFTQKVPQAEHPAIDVVVALDNSGSMASHDRGFLLREASSGFAAALSPADRCGIVIFGDGSRMPVPLKGRADADF